MCESGLATGKMDGAISGLIVPMLTPLTMERRVDGPCARRLARRLIESGVDGLFLLGSCGEGPSLAEADRREMMESVSAEAGDRVRLMIGVSESSTDRAIRVAGAAEDAGADAVVSTFPHYYAAASQQEVEAHFRALSDAVALPVIAYNIPQMAKSVIEPDTACRLARAGAIIGIKDSSGDWARFQQMLFAKRATPGFRVFQGEEKLLAVSLLSGADGVVPATANLAPRLFTCLMDVARNGDPDLAFQLQEQISELTGLYSMGIHWLAGLKAAASMLELCGKTVCRPICEADDAALAEIRRRFLPILKDPLGGLVPEHVVANLPTGDEIAPGSSTRGRGEARV